MLSSVEQAFVGREEIRAPLKTPAWEAKPGSDLLFFPRRGHHFENLFDVIIYPFGCVPDCS